MWNNGFRKGIILNIVIASTFVGFQSFAAGPQLGVEIVLDRNEFRLCDVVTGKLELTNLGTEEISFQAWLSKYIVEYEVRKPDGTTIACLDKPFDDDRRRWPQISLAPQGTVFRPVCLVKWGGEFVFDQPGVYSIFARAKFVLVGSKEDCSGESSPVEIVITGRTEDVPADWGRLFRFSECVGLCFKELAEHSADDLNPDSHGGYGESLAAYTAYQLWFNSPLGVLNPGGWSNSEFVRKGNEYFAKMGGGGARGHWLFERMIEMSARYGNIAAARPPVSRIPFSAGDVIFE